MMSEFDSKFEIGYSAYTHDLRRFKQMMETYTGIYRFHWFFAFHYTSVKEEKQMFDFFVAKVPRISPRNVNSLIKRKKYALLEYLLPQVEAYNGWCRVYYLKFSPTTRVRLNDRISFNALAKEDERLLDVILRCF